MAQKGCDRDRSRDTNPEENYGHFGVFTTISDHVTVTNPKWLNSGEDLHLFNKWAISELVSRELNLFHSLSQPFTAFYLYHSLFGPFWGPSCIRYNQQRTLK